VTIACCITTENAHSIEEVVRTWAMAGADHVTFDFYTPLGGETTRSTSACGAGPAARQADRHAPHLRRLLRRPERTYR